MKPIVSLLTMIKERSTMDFLLGNSIWVYIAIFLGKIIEVTISTLRMVLINRGEKIKGSIIAFVDVLLWLLITGSVLSNFGNNILKIIVFALAFALGNYFGSWLESKIAFGISSIQVIMNDSELVSILLTALRASSFAVTVIDGQGKDGKRKLLVIHIKRKNIPKAVKIVNDVTQDCIITVNDVKTIRGGFIKK